MAELTIEQTAAADALEKRVKKAPANPKPEAEKKARKPKTVAEVTQADIDAAFPVKRGKMPDATLPVESPISPAKEKKERKPRAEKLSVEGGDEVGGMITALREKITSDLTKKHDRALADMAKQHKAELKALVTEEEAVERERVAYESGIAYGKKEALRGLKAAMKVV